MMLTMNLEFGVATVVPACVILHKGTKTLCIPAPPQAVGQSSTYSTSDEQGIG